MAVRMADLPLHERPRERLMDRGPGALTERELIALVLRNGRAGRSAIDVATELLASYGSLRRLAAATPEELAAYPGMGPVKAASLLGGLHLSRFLDGDDPPEVLRNPEDFAAVARRELAGARREHTVALVLDSGSRLRKVAPISQGSLTRSLLPMREVLNAVLRHDGYAFAVAHNHPSGSLEPSEADIDATADLAAGARAVGLRFVDHLIVTDTGWTSLRLKGFLPG